MVCKNLNNLYNFLYKTLLNIWCKQDNVHLNRRIHGLFCCYFLLNIHILHKFLIWTSEVLVIISLSGSYLAGIYFFNVSNRNTRKMYEICSKLAIKAPKRCYWRLVSILLTLNGFYTLFWCFHCLLWTSSR